jgi:hypothetical protein
MNTRHSLALCFGLGLVSRRLEPVHQKPQFPSTVLRTPSMHKYRPAYRDGHRHLAWRHQFWEDLDLPRPLMTELQMLIRDHYLVGTDRSRGPVSID